MLMSNCYMINTFVLNLGTAAVFIFVICKLTYCIEFTKFVYLNFLSLTSRFLYLFFLNNVGFFGSLCDSGSTHNIGIQELFRYL